MLGAAAGEPVVVIASTCNRGMAIIAKKDAGIASIKDLGQSQYSELLYSRDFGKTEKDIIYKIDFDKAFAFVRFLWHVDNGNWHLVHVAYKTEGGLPFPSGWEHIYPK